MTPAWSVPPSPALSSGRRSRAHSLSLLSPSPEHHQPQPFGSAEYDDPFEEAAAFDGESDFELSGGAGPSLARLRGSHSFERLSVTETVWIAASAVTVVAIFGVTLALVAQ